MKKEISLGISLKCKNSKRKQTALVANWEENISSGKAFHLSLKIQVRRSKLGR
jgi:hypothetical protein